MKNSATSEIVNFQTKQVVYHLFHIFKSMQFLWHVYVSKAFERQQNTIQEVHCPATIVLIQFCCTVERPGILPDIE